MRIHINACRASHLCHPRIAPRGPSNLLHPWVFVSKYFSVFVRSMRVFGAASCPSYGADECPACSRQIRYRGSIGQIDGRGAAPALTFARDANGPATGGSTLTLSGTNFAPIDTSPSMSIGATQCTTSSWISTTSIMCNLPAGAGRSANATLSVSSQIGALPSWFTYDCALKLLLLWRVSCV